MAVRKRGKVWQFDFMIRGVRYRESVPEAQTKQEALQAEAEARRAVFDGRYGRSRRVTFARFVEDVFLPYARTNRKRHAQDEKVVRLFVEAFGARALSEIPPMLVEHWKKRAMQEDVPGGTKPRASTINQKLAVLHRVFSLGIENGYLKENPVSKVRRLKEGKPRERVMTREEESRLRAVMADPRYSFVLDFFELAVNTGMRAEEITGLGFDEVDFERREVNLSAARTKEGREKVVPLNAAAFAVVERARADRGQTVRVLPPEAKYQRVADLFREVRRAAGVADVRIHDLRHTFATRAVEQGVPETVVCRILGHSKLRMTAHYTHPSAEAMRAAVDALPQVCHTETRKYGVS